MADDKQLRLFMAHLDANYGKGLLVINARSLEEAEDIAKLNCPDNFDVTSVESLALNVGAGVVAECHYAE